MLESTVELLNGLFFIAMILLTAVCIVGSIVAALQAVSRRTATASSIQQKFGGSMKPLERSLGHQLGSVEGLLNPMGPETARSGHGRPVDIYRAREKDAVRG